MPKSQVASIHEAETIRNILAQRITVAHMSGMQKAQHCYIENSFLNLYVMQVLVISITQKKVKITKQEHNPFSPYQAYRESGRS